MGNNNKDIAELGYLQQPSRKAERSINSGWGGGAKVGRRLG